MKEKEGDVMVQRKEGDDERQRGRGRRETRGREEERKKKKLRERPRYDINPHPVGKNGTDSNFFAIPRKVLRI